MFEILGTCVFKVDSCNFKVGDMYTYLRENGKGRPLGAPDEVL